MYQNSCKKCGGSNLHIEIKGNNTGLYCSDCGAWIKWLGKDEIRAFENMKAQNATPSQVNPVDSNDVDIEFVKKELSAFIEFLDAQIDKELCRTPLSNEDALVKCAVALACEKDKNALINILDGRHWNENSMQ